MTPKWQILLLLQIFKQAQEKWKECLGMWTLPWATISPAFSLGTVEIKHKRNLTLTDLSLHSSGTLWRSGLAAV